MQRVIKDQDLLYPMMLIMDELMAARTVTMSLLSTLGMEMSFENSPSFNLLISHIVILFLPLDIYYMLEKFSKSMISVKRNQNVSFGLYFLGNKFCIFFAYIKNLFPAELKSPNTVLYIPDPHPY